MGSLQSSDSHFHYHIEHSVNKMSTHALATDKTSRSSVWSFILADHLPIGEVKYGRRLGSKSWTYHIVLSKSNDYQDYYDKERNDRLIICEIRNSKTYRRHSINKFWMQQTLLQWLRQTYDDKLQLITRSLYGNVMLVEQISLDAFELARKRKFDAYSDGNYTVTAVTELEDSFDNRPDEKTIDDRLNEELNKLEKSVVQFRKFINEYRYKQKQ